MVDPKKLANIPLARPGFDAINMTAPVIVQLNPEGKWEKNKPESLDEDRLKAVVQHLISSRALSSAQSYCCQCAAESQARGGKGGNQKYVPVIMMPVYAADQCPFDMKDCETEKTDPKQKKRAIAGKPEDTDSKEDKDKKKQKKRGFVLQRLTDFDLMSQW